jgi:hypothetical protein
MDEIWIEQCDAAQDINCYNERIMTGTELGTS